MVVSSSLVSLLLSIDGFRKPLPSGFEAGVSRLDNLPANESN
jgi:hypothetical protein